MATAEKTLQTPEICRVEIKVFWDAQDPANEGWAYSIHTDDGVIDTGDADMPEDAEASDFAREIMRLSDVYGAHADSIAIEPEVDGGYASASVVCRR